MLDDSKFHNWDADFEFEIIGRGKVFTTKIPEEDAVLGNLKLNGKPYYVRWHQFFKRGDKDMLALCVTEGYLAPERAAEIAELMIKEDKDFQAVFDETMN